MNISNRTKLSFSELIDLLNHNTVHTIMEKYNIPYDTSFHYTQNKQVILEADIKAIADLCSEIVRRKDDLKRDDHVTPKHRFDIRWQELELCLLLDGYRIEGNKIISIEPTIEGHTPIEDDLTKELELSALDGNKEIIRLMDNSAQSFIKPKPDYNGCLTSARIALETLVRNIAEKKGHEFKVTDNKNAWGSSLSYLKTHGFLTEQQEKTIASVYTMVSSGCHRPLGLTDEEYTRFGRNLVTSMCYFIAKLFTGSNTSTY